MTFNDRLSSLGFSSYREYLRSTYWRDFKCNYRSSGLPNECAVCGELRIQLHHVNYSRLGREKFRDVRPLCDYHHDEVHRALKELGKQVGESDLVIRKLRRAWNRPTPVRHVSEHPPQYYSIRGKKGRRRRAKRRKKLVKSFGLAQPIRRAPSPYNATALALLNAQRAIAGMPPLNKDGSRPEIVQQKLLSKAEKRKRKRFGADRRPSLLKRIKAKMGCH